MLYIHTYTYIYIYICMYIYIYIVCLVKKIIFKFKFIRLPYSLVFRELVKLFRIISVILYRKYFSDNCDCFFEKADLIFSKSAQVPSGVIRDCQQINFCHI